MVIGRYFWSIDAPANYSPTSNPGVLFGGQASGTSITGVSATVVTAIAALISGSPSLTAGITGSYIGAGTHITAAAGTTLTLNQPAGNNTSISNLQYFDAAKPSIAIGNTPIQAVLVKTAAHAAFVFTSGANTITIPASTLVKGAIYYWQIDNVVTVTSGDFLGYSAM